MRTNVHHLQLIGKFIGLWSSFRNASQQFIFCSSQKLHCAQPPLSPFKHAIHNTHNWYTCLDVPRPIRGDHAQPGHLQTATPHQMEHQQRCCPRCQTQQPPQRQPIKDPTRHLCSSASTLAVFFPSTCKCMLHCTLGHELSDIPLRGVQILWLSMAARWCL